MQNPRGLWVFHTGMRSAELAGLQWGDIDFNGTFLTVRRSWVDGRIHRTKTNRIRRVDLSDALLEALIELKRHLRKEWLSPGVRPQCIFLMARSNSSNRAFSSTLRSSSLWTAIISIPVRSLVLIVVGVPIVPPPSLPKAAKKSCAIGP